MSEDESKLVIGEFERTLDERHRVWIPPDLLKAWQDDDGKLGKLIVAKERRGCLSVWAADVWNQHINQRKKVVLAKVEGGLLQGRITEVQMFGRMLSTGYKETELDKNNRLLVPEGFREFLGVEQGGAVLVIGAAVCVELWSPEPFTAYVEKRMPRFRKLMERLST